MSDVTSQSPTVATSDETSRPHSVQSGAAFPRLVALTLLMSVPLILGLCFVLAPLEALDVLLVVLFALNALWVSAAAATALIAVTEHGPPKELPPAGWTPKKRTAILFLICGEDPASVAKRLVELHRRLINAGQSDTTDIWLLSDTPGSQAQREQSAIANLCASGVLHYRHRARNTGRKPGNIADWIEHFGADYTTMLVMDADSAMTVDRLTAMRYQMERTPRLALLQSGIAFRPGVTRFARLQRLSARLTGPVFIRGLQAWSGRAGNYWGHNALIRIEAFRAVMRLPRLRGPAPYGGDFLSHDFVEAALIVQNGWRVEIAPDTRGSSEDGPEDLETFHRRDRRWSQGNLQHLRPLLGSRLHRASRIHLASGVQSYLASPIWLLLILLFVLAGMAPGAVPVLSGALALLLVPKFAALVWFFRRTERSSRRKTFLRATATELWLSTLLSPIVMVRQTISVIAVLLGQDCGWKGANARRLPRLPYGTLEAVAGTALVIVAVVGGETVWQVLWLTPIAGPLLAAPWLVPWLDSPQVS